MTPFSPSPAIRSPCRSFDDEMMGTAKGVCLSAYLPSCCSSQVRPSFAVSGTLFCVLFFCFLISFLFYFAVAPCRLSPAIGSPHTRTHARSGTVWWHMFS